MLMDTHTFYLTPRMEFGSPFTGDRQKSGDGGEATFWARISPCAVVHNAAELWTDFVRVHPR